MKILPFKNDDFGATRSEICDKYGINVSLWYPACNPGEF